MSGAQVVRTGRVVLQSDPWLERGIRSEDISILAIKTVCDQAEQSRRAT